VAGLAASLLVGCTATRPGLSVPALVAAAAAQDGTRVTVHGRLHLTHGLINLYSRNRRLCVGLLVPINQVERFRRLAGREVTVSGRVQAEGCGREGICDEHLCGPAILRDVELL